MYQNAKESELMRDELIPCIHEAQNSHRKNARMDDSEG